MKHPEITDRQREILLKTLELYISTGSPVGSHVLADEVGTSSSTVRAELSDLESRGLLTHPHTSAGRVPTDAGYRFYVDSLIDVGPETNAPLEAVERHDNLDELLRDISEGMSDVTRLLAVVAGPSAIGESLSRVDFLPLPEKSLLLVVSMESGASSSATVTLPANVEEDELREIFTALNSWLGGREIGRDFELAKAARKALADHDPLVIEAVLDAVEALGRANERGVFVRGASALLSHLDDLDPESVAAVVEIFERRRWLLRLMGDALQRSVSAGGSGIIVSIGAENVFHGLGGTSLVAAAYSSHERPFGVVSLIGPKRMDYDSAITTVRSASETLTHYLNARF
ncbi:MAG: heat-inducible transcriptional repressor HrcA [Actinomycetota bacterium]|jgi:heat-inducible transcriptional repressor|nr:heat-inducible transcription repressor HrcA [Rubrobacter sp.]MDQ3508488.1 heat-inducible transcriptional repressor HrcA [Actinomycetota bacterium]